MVFGKKPDLSHTQRFCFVFAKDLLLDRLVFDPGMPLLRCPCEQASHTHFCAWRGF